jgi:hypothetical protein
LLITDFGVFEETRLREFERKDLGESLKNQNQDKKARSPKKVTNFYLLFHHVPSAVVAACSVRVFYYYLLAYTLHPHIC